MVVRTLYVRGEIRRSLGVSRSKRILDELGMRSLK